MATANLQISTSRRLLKQADRECRAGRLTQASAKGWQAVAHAIEVVAKQRGWPHQTEKDLFQVTSDIAKEQDNLEILDYTLEAGALEYNSHEDWFDKLDVQESLEKMAEFVELLEGVASSS